MIVLFRLATNRGILKALCSCIIRFSIQYILNWNFFTLNYFSFPDPIFKLCLWAEDTQDFKKACDIIGNEDQLESYLSRQVCDTYLNSLFHKWDKVSQDIFHLRLTVNARAKSSFVCRVLFMKKTTCACYFHLLFHSFLSI